MKRLGSLRGRHRRSRRPQDGHDRRHDLRQKKPVVLEVDGLPGAGHFARYRAEDQGRPGEARRRHQKLMAEDPTFRVKTDQQTGEVVIAGMGELHLEIIVDRLKREFNVEASVGRPQVAYKETLTRPADGEMKLRQADRRPRPIRPRENPRLSRSARAAGTCSRTRSAAARFRRNTSSPCDEGIEEALYATACRRYPIDDVHRALRRLVPRGRLVGNGVQDCRLHGVSGRGQEGEAGAARARDAGRGGRAQGTHGRRHRQPLGATRAHSVTGRPWRHADHQARVPLAEMFGYGPICGHARRAARLTPCTSTATSRRHRMCAKKSSRVCRERHKGYGYRDSATRFASASKVYDNRVLDQSTTEIVDTARRTGARAGRADSASDQKTSGPCFARRTSTRSRASSSSSARTSG